MYAWMLSRCVCVCVCACMYACMHVCMCMYVCICGCMYVRMYVGVCTCTCTYVCMCGRVDVMILRARRCVRIFSGRALIIACIAIYIYVCIHAFITTFIFIPLYAHSLSLPPATCMHMRDMLAVLAHCRMCTRIYDYHIRACKNYSAPIHISEDSFIC